MSLAEFKDPSIATEVGPQLGKYLTSFAFAGRIVEIHVFEAPSGELVAFITSSPGLPVTVAHQQAEVALEIVGARGSSRGAPRFVYDPDSLRVSGSV